MSALENRDGVDSAPAAAAPPRKSLERADLVMATIFFAMFAAGLVASQSWGFKTALFPRVVTVLGLLVTSIFIVNSLWTWRRAPASEAVAATATDSTRDAAPELIDEDDEHDQEVEYIFATAGRAAWSAALGWVALFIVLIYTGGLFVASAGFALTYLRWGGATVVALFSRVRRRPHRRPVRRAAGRTDCASAIRGVLRVEDPRNASAAYLYRRRPSLPVRLQHHTISVHRRGLFR